MIEIDVKRSEAGGTRTIIGFRAAGHAGFSQYGTDVVCAGVSALIINCINSIERFSDTKFDLVQNEKDGILEFTCKEPLDESAMLLLKSMFLGLQEIQGTYGNEYVTIH